MSEKKLLAFDSESVSDVVTFCELLRGGSLSPNSIIDYEVVKRLLEDPGNQDTLRGLGIVNFGFFIKFLPQLKARPVAEWLTLLRYVDGEETL